VPSLAWRADSLERKASTNFGATSSTVLSPFRISMLKSWRFRALASFPNVHLCASPLLFWLTVDLFDAEFFGIHPREAELMDPQHRLFLECCWQALEDAAYDPFTYQGSLGCMRDAAPHLFLSRLCTNAEFIQSFTGGYQVGNYLEMLGNIWIFSPPAFPTN